MMTQHPLRLFLDGMYRYAGYLAAFFLVMIFLFVALQMGTRWIGGVIAGASDFTGYCMAAASFLALPYALNSGTHIRVNLLLNGLGRYRKFGEIWCWLIGSILAVIWAYFAVKLTLESYEFNEISQGQDAWPIWIPQMSMAIGCMLLAVAAIDNLITLIMFGKDNVENMSDIQVE